MVRRIDLTLILKPKIETVVGHGTGFKSTFDSATDDDTPQRFEVRA